MRMQDCKDELHSLLQEDVSFASPSMAFESHICSQRLAGASLLVFANKQDIQGSMTDSEIRDVGPDMPNQAVWLFTKYTGVKSAFDYNPSLENMVVQRCDGRQPCSGLGLGRR